MFIALYAPKVYHTVIVCPGEYVPPGDITTVSLDTHWECDVRANANSKIVINLFIYINIKFKVVLDA